MSNRAMSAETQALHAISVPTLTLQPYPQQVWLQPEHTQLAVLSRGAAPKYRMVEPIGDDGRLTCTCPRGRQSCWHKDRYVKIKALD